MFFTTDPFVEVHSALQHCTIRFNYRHSHHSSLSTFGVVLQVVFHPRCVGDLLSIMSTFKASVSEVKQEAADYLAALVAGIQGGTHEAEDHQQGLGQVTREETVLSVAVVALRILEGQSHRSEEEKKVLAMSLKQCRRQLKTSLHQHESTQSSETRTSPSSSHEKQSGVKRTRDDTPHATSPHGSQQTGRRDGAVDTSAVDLGQYANAHAFDDNEKKRMKFARLMGGAKAGHLPSNGAERHNTIAANAKAVKTMNRDLEAQFETAMHHKGKKGLGA